MKTKETVVKKEVSVWAIPKSNLQPNEWPFEYELGMSSTYHWRTGAVCVYTTEVEVALPPGINLIEMAMATLQEARRQVTADYQSALRSIDEEIHKLQLLTAPMTIVVDGAEMVVEPAEGR